MKYIKTFKKLFESLDSPEGYEWDCSHAIEALENPENSEFPFTEMVDQDTADYNSRTWINFMSCIGSYSREISKLNFLNVIKYIVRMDNAGFANWCLGNFINVFELGEKKDFLRMTIVFEDKFFNDPMMRIKTMMVKKSVGVVGENETEDDLRREVEEVESGMPPKEVVLAGKDLERAIDNALDRRDFEEVARLSKMMKESESYNIIYGSDIENIFNEYLKIF